RDSFADRARSWPELLRDGTTHDHHARPMRSVVLGEAAPAFDAHAHRAKVSGNHGEGVDAILVRKLAPVLEREIAGDDVSTKRQPVDRTRRLHARNRAE